MHLIRNVPYISLGPLASHPILPSSSSYHPSPSPARVYLHAESHHNVFHRRGYHPRRRRRCVAWHIRPPRGHRRRHAHRLRWPPDPRGPDGRRRRLQRVVPHGDARAAHRLLRAALAGQAAHHRAPHLLVMHRGVRRTSQSSFAGVGSI